jgi:DNA-binding response OmpR family regulator
MAKIVIIDSDRVACDSLRHKLEREGYEVCTAQDGEQGLDLARQDQPDLVILEAMLPKLDGFAVCRMLRFESDMPILMLTTYQDEAHRVLGLDLGADDYVIKPFLPGELLARIRALLRRSDRPTQRPARTIIEIDGLTLDLGNRRAFLGEGELHLSQKEFDLLTCLMQNRGVALSREALLEQVWGNDFKTDTRTIDVHIRWLRTKIEADSTQPHYIHTVRGLGYRFTDGQNGRQVPRSVALTR